MQLINCSGISICMVGIPESVEFFEMEEQLARRSLGLFYQPLEYGDEFRRVVTTVWNYQFTMQKMDISDRIIRWLYEHSNGIMSVLIVLFHDAQELAILRENKRIDIDILEESYRKRMGMLHSSIQIQTVKHTKTACHKKKVRAQKALSIVQSNEYISMIDICDKARADTTVDVVSALREQITVEEVAI